jgi:hypothetical protein
LKIGLFGEASENKTPIFNRRQITNLPHKMVFTNFTSWYPILAECYTLVLRRLGRAYSRSWLEEILQGSMLLNPEEVDFLSGCSLIAKFRDQPRPCLM